ncbi:hypothetical protein BDW60DRAFT_154030 [Aspergillus nidulans var. acristatus]
MIPRLSGFTTSNKHDTPRLQSTSQEHFILTKLWSFAFHHFSQWSYLLSSLKTHFLISNIYALLMFATSFSFYRYIVSRIIIVLLFSNADTQLNSLALFSSSFPIYHPKHSDEIRKVLPNQFSVKRFILSLVQYNNS